MEASNSDWKEYLESLASVWRQRGLAPLLRIAKPSSFDCYVRRTDNRLYQITTEDQNFPPKFDACTTYLGGVRRLCLVGATKGQSTRH
jgi:hypothetical protein